MYPPPADFKFDQDSYKFIGLLAAIAICSFVYTIATKVTKRLTNNQRVCEPLVADKPGNPTTGRAHQGSRCGYHRPTPGPTSRHDRGQALRPSALEEPPNLLHEFESDQCFRIGELCLLRQDRNINRGWAGHVGHCTNT